MPATEPFYSDYTIVPFLDRNMATTSPEGHRAPPLPPALPPSKDRGSSKSARVPKVRSSCDECSAAKVRCSKTKPRCERCVNFNVECVYGYSMKRGRGSSKQQRPRHHQPLGIPQQSLTAFDMDLQHLYSEDMVLDPWVSSGLPGTELVPPIDTSYNGSMMLEGFDCTTYDMSSSSANMSQASTSGYDSLDELLSTSPAPPAESTQIDQSGSCAPSQAQKANQNSALHNECYEIAHCALANLCFQPRPPSPSRRNRQDFQDAYTLNFDDILQGNKEALTTLEQLLNCTCSKSPHMALLCASMITRIIFWHRVAVGSSVSYVMQQPMGSRTAGKQRMLSIASSPMTMGAYTPDEEEQRLMQRLPLLRNLKALGERIESFRGLGDLQQSLATSLQAELNQASNDVSIYGESS